MKPEQEWEEQFGNCITDAVFKSGAGSLIGSLASLLFFKRKMWPICTGLFVGIGMSARFCENKLNQIIIDCEEKKPEPEKAAKAKK